MRVEDKVIPFVMAHRSPCKEYQVQTCGDAWSAHEVLGHLLHKLEDDLHGLKGSRVEDDADMRKAEILRAAAVYRARNVRALAAELVQKLDRLTLEIEDGPVTDLGVSDLRTNKGGES